MCKRLCALIIIRDGYREDRILSKDWSACHTKHDDALSIQWPHEDQCDRQLSGYSLKDHHRWWNLVVPIWYPKWTTVLNMKVAIITKTSRTAWKGRCCEKSFCDWQGILHHEFIYSWRSRRKCRWWYLFCGRPFTWSIPKCSQPKTGCSCITVPWYIGHCLCSSILPSMILWCLCPLLCCPFSLHVITSFYGWRIGWMSVTWRLQRMSEWL